MKNRATLGLGTLMVVALSGASACTQPPVQDQVVGLSAGAPFVSVRKPFALGREPSASDREPLRPHTAVADAAAPRALASDVVAGGRGDSDFYVGIKKSLLGERWFLSAYVKQFYPDNQALEGDQLLADRPLGTRVVSFKLQNGRLFVFDASETLKQSALQDPSVLVEAYPVVEQPEFSALPGSDEYVLFDPAQGLNDFSLSGETFADAHLQGAQPLNVGLSYLQNFHELADGVAFEQVFAGEALIAGSQSESAWGTLGLSLRRYRVGEHFHALPAPSTPFFLSSARFVSESQGNFAQDALHWDFYPGMQPVEVFIGGGALRAQADYPDVDVLGALQRGVESWNDVFGFPVFQATVVEDDEVRDDDSSFVLVDYPGAGNGTSRGHVRSNPDNGEIRAANVYLAGGAFQGLSLLGLEPVNAEPEPPAPPATTTAAARPRLQLSWSGLSGDASQFEDDPAPEPEAPPAPEVGATAEERAALWIQAYLVHEVGHTLGLRHNFKGSLVAPGSSVMDYSSFEDTFATATPQAYDVAAIRYLYGLSTELPTQPFCTDEDTLSDPNCAQWDSGAQPLYDFWAPVMAQAVDQVIAAQQPLELLDRRGLSQLANFARDTVSSGFTAAEDRTNALRLALGRTLVPFDKEILSAPEQTANANAAAELILRRIVLEPATSAGLSDPQVLRFLGEQAGLMLRNADGARSFALRRTAADVLRRLQSDGALIELRASRQALVTALQGAQAGSADLALTQDLLDRVDALLTPYYN